MNVYARRPLAAETGTLKLIGGSAVIDKNSIECQNSNGIVVYMEIYMYHSTS